MQPALIDASWYHKHRKTVLQFTGQPLGSTRRACVASRCSARPRASRMDRLKAPFLGSFGAKTSDSTLPQVSFMWRGIASTRYASAQPSHVLLVSRRE